MINLTVKTLDSQNHVFCVEDEITISEFKIKIADTVNIPPETQRLIYCGRVLQDSSKLQEYDVDGKVIHLVQRPPPSSTLSPDAPEPQPPHPQRRVRGLEYVGTVRLPVSGIENTLHSLPIQSLANSRLNVARRMISRAETVLNALENPNRQEQPAPSEPQEEATPVFEARVVIPSATTIAPGETFDTQSQIIAGPIVPLQESLMPPIESIEITLSNEATNSDPPHSVSTTPEVISPLARSTENLTTVGAEPNNLPDLAATVVEVELPPEVTSAPQVETVSVGTSTTANPSGNVSHTAEFADILDSLNRLQTRFMPFMEQYNTFMRCDPVVLQENVRSTQAMINRVSEVCHFLGHAYHSVSDIIVRGRTPPPRSLLCRPMLIQHSAVVQVDIPIQVEAQINIPSDRNNSTAATTTTSSATTTATTQPAGATTVTTSAVQSSSPSDVPLTTLLGIPFMPRSGVRVETFRLPIFDGNNLMRNNNNTSSSATFRTNSNSAHSDAYIAAVRALGTRGLSSNSTTTTPSNTTSSEPLPAQPMDVASAIASSVVNSLTGNAAAENNSGGTTMNINSSPGGPNNPNVEFFMEVTPESITIDSLETAFVGGNQGNDFNAILQESMNPPPPEFIQSIMQMAGQLINRSNIPTNTTASTTSASSVNSAAPTVTASPTPSAPPLEVSSSTTSDTTATTNAGAARTTPFQNSQARGNTQTQPTTATHTRSTPRPHVHLAQHTMHAFDPFLPCNSHHIINRRRFHNATNNVPQQNTTPQNNSTAASGEITNVASPVYNIVRNLLSSVRNTYSNALPPAYAAQRFQVATTGPGTNTSPLQDLMRAAAAWMSAAPEGNYMDHRPTVARILQHFPDNNYVTGESIFTDLIILLARALTFGDITQIVNGQLEPLSRISAEIRTFVVYRVLEGDISEAGYDGGIEKLLREMQPFLNHLALWETKDNIDIARSTQALLRARLPNIFLLATSHNPNSTRLMFEQIQRTVQQLGALMVYASLNGNMGVFAFLESLMMRFMEGVPNDLQQWCLETTSPSLRTFINNLEVPENLLQRYIVRRADTIMTDVVVENRIETPEPEPMQIEEVVETTITASDDVDGPTLHLTDNSDTVQTVVIGSSPWHTQVPSDWVPIIVRDTQRQRRQSSQGPFSDAYLSGMPSKRRKLAESNKPPSSISQVISERVRRAVTATGLTTAAPIETVTQEAAADVNIRSAYRELLHNSVQSELENNADFTPEQFPNVDSYFNNRPQ